MEPAGVSCMHRSPLANNVDAHEQQLARWAAGLSRCSRAGMQSWVRCIAFPAAFREQRRRASG
jgi:hypothetical protein